jgi:hypothetical protein
VGLFGPRRPCPHCGKKVKKPSDPSGFLCPRCRKPGPWASPDQIADWERSEAERERLGRLQADARQRYSETLAALASGAPTDTTQLPVLATQTGLAPEQLAQKRTEAFTSYVQRAVGDEILTPEEEEHVQELVRILGVDLGAFLQQDPELGRHVMVAEANGGFLPAVLSSRLVQKRGEIVHLEVEAALLKDVTVRQSQGGYSGFSFPIGKTGIRYRVGGYRGHSVEVGTKRVPADDGFLVISSPSRLHRQQEDDRAPIREARQSHGVQRRRSVPHVEPSNCSRVRRSSIGRRRGLRSRCRSTSQR